MVVVMLGGNLKAFKTLLQGKTNTETIRISVTNVKKEEKSNEFALCLLLVISMEQNS